MGERGRKRKANHQTTPMVRSQRSTNAGHASIGPFVLEKQPYDPIADFTHIASIGSAPCVVMANPAAGINTIGAKTL